MEFGTRPEVLAATPTTFAEDGKLDLDAFAALLERLSASALDGLFLNGTAGEFAALDRAERYALAEVARALIGRGKRLVLHVGATSAYGVRQLLEDAHSLGITEVAVITPYFLPADDDALLRFYRDVSAGAAGMHVYAYLYRQVTGNHLGESVLEKVAELPGFVGAKISGETPERLEEYAHRLPEGFAIYAGADQELIPMCAHGARGVVSAMSAALPGPFTALAAAAGPDASAQRAVDDVCRVLAGDVSRIKYALGLQGIKSYPRIPSAPLGADVEREIARLVEEYGSPR